jgi:hypothetical protein
MFPRVFFYRRPGSETRIPRKLTLPSKMGVWQEVENPVPSVPYSVLPPGEHGFVIVAGSFEALISSLSSSIYLLALDSLARHMNVFVSWINLTITTYLVYLKWSSVLILMLTRCKYLKD